MEPLFTAVGANYRTSDASLRGALAAKPEEAGRLNAAVADAAGLDDAAVVSTCSRFEVYAGLDEAGVGRLKEALERRAGRPLGSALYVRRGEEAVRHLFRVAAGLDSWIIGETEILGQVKSAYQEACREKTAGRAIHLAFQRALFVGKKVRAETSIVGGIASIGGAAGVLARCVFKDLRDRRLLVFGAGAIASATIKHLRSKDVGRLWVANRSPERAQALARELGGEPMSLEAGFERLAEADVAVFSTGASSYLLDRDRARRISRERSGRPLFVIDLGLPRNVDPRAAEAEGVFVYDMDDLRRMMEESLKRREADIARAQAIIDDEGSECWDRVAASPDPSKGPAEPRRCPLRPGVPIWKAV